MRPLVQVDMAADFGVASVAGVSVEDIVATASVVLVEVSATKAVVASVDRLPRMLLLVLVADAVDTAVEADMIVVLLAATGSPCDLAMPTLTVVMTVIAMVTATETVTAWIAVETAIVTVTVTATATGMAAARITDASDTVRTMLPTTTRAPADATKCSMALPLS